MSVEEAILEEVKKAIRKPPFDEDLKEIKGGNIDVLIEYAGGCVEYKEDFCREREIERIEAELLIVIESK